MEAKLVVVGGKANKAEVPLKLPATLGRGRDTQLTIAHPTVSRHHCQVYELDGVLMVKDKGSLNGTFIDGERIDADRILRPGQTLTVGPLTFRAEYEVADSAQDVLTDVPVAEESAEAQSVTPAPQPAALPLPPPVDAPETIHFASDGLNETTDLPPVPMAAEAAKPADDDSGEFALPVEAEAENESGQFDFLADEPIRSEVGKTDAPALADGDDEEIFSFADEPPSIDTTKPAKNPSDKKSKPSKTADASKPGVSKAAANGDAAKSSDEPPRINVGAEPAPAVHQSDDDLNNFLESLGLE
ncbi:MAG TPA: FHA domain-containing protein [Pirellulales bacterium]|nr:FHA domain-containing protein [Pirellulales bacterium]